MGGLEGQDWVEGSTLYSSGISCFPACGILGQQAGIWGLDSRIWVGHVNATDGGGLAVFPLASLGSTARRVGLWSGRLEEVSFGDQRHLPGGCRSNV